MNEQIDLIAYGKMQAEVAQLAKDVHELKDMVKTMSDIMQQAKGGWRVLAMVGGVAGTFGAVVAWMASHWSKVL